jgi:methylenetetrahydrofolate dehydrogenase (NADP+)/methenyltetrahydrofolate cyclohydrolase
MRLLSANGVRTKGAHAVVLSRSNLVGKPMALLLLQKSDDANATVTVVHTGTVDPESIARQADILIVAIGHPEVVGASWVKPGATVIDVGTHRLDGGTLCGDVRFDEVAAVAGAITPVPGGVGPMTVAMLLENTLKSARRRADTHSS